MLGLLLTAGVDPKNLGWFSLFIFLIVVGCVIAFAILHPALPIPFTSPRRYIHLDHAHPPLAGVLLLWIVQSTDWHTIWIGIAGEGTVEPYSILILFNALAYVCISVDQTGVFAWIAIKIARKAGSSGSKLFLYFYATASVMAIVTSNDVTILTLTPIIYYTCICTDQPPLPFLIAEYYAANIWSMTLYISSPTNIIVAQAEQVTFLEYMQWMLLPSIVSGCSTYIMLYWWFRNQINPTFAPLAVDERMALVDIRGAIFGSINLSINLFLLIIAQELKPLELWHICLFHGIVQLIYNIYAYTYHSHELPPLPPSEAEREAKYRAVTAAGEAGELSQIAGNGEEEEIALNGQTGSDETELQSPATAHAKRNSLLQTQQQQHQQQQEEHSDEHDDDRVMADEVQIDDEPEIDSHNGRFEQTDRLNMDGSVHEQYDLQHEQAVARLRDQLRVRLTVWSAINSMPWRIIPYAGGMFILVNILKAGGWLDLLSQGLASACYSTGSCVWTFSWLSIFLDNTINDQPMSILLSYVLLNDNFISGVEGGEKGSAFRGAMWSTIMASNLGACFTLIGALAGLMWAAILLEKGIKITYLQFAAYGFLLIPVCIVTTFAVQIELI